MEERPELWREIQDKLGCRWTAVAESNRRQALLPRGARCFPTHWDPRPE